MTRMTRMEEGTSRTRELLHFFIRVIRAIRGKISSVQAFLIKTLIHLPSASMNRAQTFRNRLRFSRRRLAKTGRGRDFAIPMFRPDAVRLAQTRRPGKHRVHEVD